jgi:hypothetical protein
MQEYAQDFTKEEITMTKIRNKILTAALLLALGGLQVATAAMYTSSLGNTTPGYNDGDSPGAFALGQVGPAPFDQGYGSDALVFMGNFSQNWTHTYAPIAEEILSASITIGIFDHDSAATGSQLSSFVVGGTDFTASLDSMFETVGDGLDGMYNEYTINLSVALFASLADGSAMVTLNMLGPGLVTPLFPLPGPNSPEEVATNGANLIFSSLTIETDSSIPAVPIPAAAPLFLSAIAAFGLYRRRVLRSQA